MDRPRVKPHVVAVLVSPGNLLVRGPGLFVRYAGDTAEPIHAILRLFDGTRTVAQVARASGHTEEDVRDVLAALDADGVVEDAGEDARLDLDAAMRARLGPQLQLFSHLSAHPSRLQNALGASRVIVLGAGPLVEPIARLVGASGASVERHEIDPLRVVASELERAIQGRDHAVLALDAPFRIAFLAMNEAALAQRVRWTAVVLDGLEACVGPTVIPGESACWRCHDLREKGAHPNLERLLAYEAKAPHPPRALGTPAFAEAVAALAAHALVLTLSGGALPLVGRVTRVGMLDLQARSHRVLRVPRCPACSPAAVPDVDRYALEPVDLG